MMKRGEISRGGFNGTLFFIETHERAAAAAASVAILYSRDLLNGIRMGIRMKCGNGKWFVPGGGAGDGCSCRLLS